MKLLMENWRNHLNEIGEGTLTPYEFSATRDLDLDDSMLTSVQYDFSSEENNYTVDFDLLGGWVSASGGGVDPRYWDINYYISESGAMKETGEGKPLKIMSTVLAIIKDFIASNASRGIKLFSFEGIPKGFEAGGWETPQIETKRTKLYMAYLKKNMPPGTKIERKGKGGNHIYFELPAEERDLEQVAE